MCCIECKSWPASANACTRSALTYSPRDVVEKGHEKQARQ